MLGHNCDPLSGEACPQLDMFKLDNHFYHDICSPTIQIKPPNPYHTERGIDAEPGITELPIEDFRVLVKTELCKVSDQIASQFLPSTVSKPTRNVCRAVVCVA